MFLIYFVLFFFAPVPVFAYLDPGTGSLLLYAVIGLLTTLVFALRGVWYWIRSHLFLSKKTVARELPDIVFHSEGGKYWHVFEPVIRELNNMQIPAAYVTPDKNDPAFTKQADQAGGYQNLSVVHPGKDVVTISYMNNIKAKVVVSTTPQLDVLMWKRSKNVGHYTHLFHAPVDVATYDLYAFDHYDSLLCTGEFQKKSVREIERNRNRKTKKIFETGCTYYDGMLTEMEALTRPESAEKRPTVLYAPAWGARSSLIKHGRQIIDELGKSAFAVIFRPHPQLYVSNAAEIAHIEEQISHYANIRIDHNRTPVESIFLSDILLTDLSGIIFDYALLGEKPIILFEGHFNFGGVEAEDMGNLPVWDQVTAEKITCRFKIDNFGQLVPMIEAQLKNSAVSQKNHECIKKEIYNFGHAGKVAAAQIAALAAAENTGEDL